MNFNSFLHRLIDVTIDEVDAINVHINATGSNSMIQDIYKYVDDVSEFMELYSISEREALIVILQAVSARLLQINNNLDLHPAVQSVINKYYESNTH
jgi:hypothetical protein